jgi:thioredoxin reductase
MVPGGIRIGKERLNVLVYADDIVLLGKNEIEIRQLFMEMESAARKLGLQINQEKKNKIHDSGKDKHLKTKNRTLENKRLQI